MPRILIKSRLHSNKHKPKFKQEINNTKTFLRQNYNHLSKNYYQEMVLLGINELRRLPNIR